MIAAIFVETGGCYFGVPGVEPWDYHADARLYSLLGPGYPVVAHPPCDRWGRYWGGGPSVKVKKKLGDDGGCFAAALDAVENYGGVLEHPEASHAWRTFGLDRPPFHGGWIRTRKGWTCCVAQGHYGHFAQKLTWLYAVVPRKPPDLVWGRCRGKARLDYGFHSAEERRNAIRGLGPRRRSSKRENAATPAAFRDVLLQIALMALER